MTQTHVPERAYGFDSRPGYFAVMPQLVMGRSRKPVIRESGLGVRGLRSAPVGAKRRSTGPSAPSHSAMETWLNWQKHFPAKEGPGEPACGIETHCLRSDVAYEHHLEILYHKFNDKPVFP